MKYQKKEIRTFQSGKAVNDQFYIDGDYNVPDAKRDVGKVILSDGMLQVEEMKQVESYLKVSGKLEFKILYMADEMVPAPASLEGRIPFEEMIYLEQEPEGTLALKTADVDLTVTVIHSRKLNIKTLAEITIVMEKCTGEEITTDVEGEIPIFKKMKEEELLKVFATGKDTYRIKEEIALSGTKENIGTLLWTDVTGGKADTQIGTDELLIQGELNVFCLYETVEGKTDWVSRMVLYEGRIECVGAMPGMYHQAVLRLVDVGVEPRMDENGEMRILGIEATLEVRLVVYEEERIQILEDMYMLDHICVPDIKEKRFFRLNLQNHSKCRISEELTLPELKDDILQICHCKGKIQMDTMKAEEDGIHIEGVLHLQFLYVREDDQAPFGVWNGMVPFSYLLENGGGEPDMDDLDWTVEQLSVGLMGSGEVEVKAVLAFNCFQKEPVQIQNIESAEFRLVDTEELENRPGIVGYFVQNGDTLWNLAKKYNTTVENIKEVNHMEKEDVNKGDKILIFKQNLSIL